REGVRGSRHDHTAGLLTELTGAEAALVVNNNAGAMLLALDTLAKGKEVIVSRGELVEIGGSFRVPEVIACSGCALVEVGATNKTRIADVERAIDSEKTGALLKVHTSNFRIEGFTQAVSLAELTALGQKYGLPVIHDLGSGCLLSPWPGLDEPTVSESVRAGADAICFSGDKLLGGPQSGIILGRRDYIARMRNNPLVRALRVDKLTLAALEATLRLYWDPERARREIPVLAMLFAERKSLRAKARRLKRLLDKTPAGAFCALADTEGQVGGGAMPGQTLPSAAVAVTATDSISLTALEEYLRRWETPIIARVSRERLLLDVLAVAEKDFPLVAACLAAAFASALAKEGDKL
ncbi:MAG: L-seryl-tRNA(Sec) selenium transferase, partial [Peptococcaceae bacterium]|nr:L-seryl-tRNA(Sec) selenium transferase [Peptococcaceae bacterium]